jgi:hypothetical protein
MGEIPGEAAETKPIQQADFERITTLVSTQFQVEETLLDRNVPTYYLKQPQETKQAFLRLLKSLEQMNLTAVLRRSNKRILLRVLQKPSTKPSNILINWILFFATIGTTFLTGYMLSQDLTNPLAGGLMFTVAIMAVLGMHEMGHKLTANKKGIDATPPYFIPGPPPIGNFLQFGTFGAVIMQKSLPPNRDTLFDVGANGPIVGFILALIVTVIGLPLSTVKFSDQQLSGIPVPLLFWLLIGVLITPPAGQSGKYAYILLHPVAIAGWVGMIVTLFQLMPAAMLDGGHVARSLFGDKMRWILTAFSVLSLVFVSPPMAIFVLFFSMFKHPGPLDDVSSLSTSRKLLAVLLVVILVLCSFFQYLFFILLGLLSG